MNKTKAVVVCVLAVSSTLGFACVGAVDSSAHELSEEAVGIARLSDHEDDHGDDINKKKKDERRSKGESSPYVVGAWKFQEKECDPYDSSKKKVNADTEFRFINPTKRDLKLEFAFFETDGTFCGCDREEIDPNETVSRTVFQERERGKFFCDGRSGALKAIVFKEKNGKLFLDDATQVGFQTHAFGDVQEPEDYSSDFIVGNVMTEAGLEGVEINDATLDDIRFIHQKCSEYYHSDD